MEAGIFKRYMKISEHENGIKLKQRMTCFGMGSLGAQLMPLNPGGDLSLDNSVEPSEESTVRNDSINNS